MDGHLELEHTGLIIVSHLTDGLVYFQDEPLRLWIWVSEITDISLPVADWMVAFHKIDIDFVHFFNACILGLNNLLIFIHKSLTPSVIA